MCGLPAASLVAGALGPAVEGPGGGASTAGLGAKTGAGSGARPTGVRAAGAGSALKAAAFEGLAPWAAARAEAWSGRPSKRAHPPKSPAATAARPPKARPMFNRSIGSSIKGAGNQHRARPPIARSLELHCFARNNACHRERPHQLMGQSRRPRKERAGAAACTIDGQPDPFAKRRIEAFKPVGGSLEGTQRIPEAGGAIVDGPWLNGEAGLAEGADR